MTLRQLAGTVLAVLAACGSASAQGNGHGNAYGHYKSTVSSASSSASTPGTSAAAIPGTGVRNFGSWLDDASILDRGDGFVSFGFGVFKTPIYREIDFPSVDSGFALTDRVQLGMTVPYYHANALGAPMSRGFGDIYLNAKVQLRAPTAGRLGVGLIPMVEVLSVAPPSGGGRMQWALPVSVERQWSGWRLMGTSGYFSRGSVFGAAAVERQLSDRAWATGSLSHAYSFKQDDLSTALGFHAARTDVTGGLTYAVRPDLSVFGSLGRTISARDDNSATLMFATGVSFGVSRPRR